MIHKYAARLVQLGVMDYESHLEYRWNYIWVVGIPMYYKGIVTMIHLIVSVR